MVSSDVSGVCFVEDVDVDAALLVGCIPGGGGGRGAFFKEEETAVWGRPGGIG